PVTRTFSNFSASWLTAGAVAVGVCILVMACSSVPPAAPMPDMPMTDAAPDAPPPPDHVDMGHPDTTPDAGPDAGPDLGLDVGPDVPDAVPPTDTGPDVGPDGPDGPAADVVAVTISRGLDNPLAATTGDVDVNFDGTVAFAVAGNGV